MEQYIKKSALVAEIQKRRNKHFNSWGSPSSEYCHEDDEILGIIDTLEVKEVDSNDAFIEKACEWLEPVFKNYAGYNCGMDLVEDFRKYMKRE